MKQCEACAHSHRRGETELHVGYGPALRAQIVSPTLRAFQREMPKVHVKLHDWSNEKIVTGLRDGRLQLAFIVRPSKRGAFRDLRFEELLREQVRLAVPPNHPFAQRRSVSLANAIKEPFVGLTREDFPDYNAYLNAVFAPVKNKPRVIEEHDSMTQCHFSDRGWHGSRNIRGGCWLQLRQSSETSATHSRAKATFLRHRHAQRKT